MELKKIEQSAYAVYYEETLQSEADILLGEIIFQENELCKLYDLKVPFIANFYLFNTVENFRFFSDNNCFAENSIKIALDKIKTGMVSEAALRELGVLIFNELAGKSVEKSENKPPSWLKEGLALQISYETINNKTEFLIKAWDSLKELLSGKGLIPFSLMEKDINYIPNPIRRKQAEYQAYYMVKLLLSLQSKNFFKAYSNCLREGFGFFEAFNKTTKLNYDQFYAMFKICVENDALLI